MRIDFAPPSLHRAMLKAPRLAWAMFFMSLAMVPSLAGSSMKYHALLREQVNEQARIQALAVRSVPTARPAAPPLSAAQASKINAAVLQLNLPWLALHDALQTATPASIALLSLEPDARKRNLRITAEAKNSDDMITYVEQLRLQDLFGAVSLVHHELNQQDPNRPIRFQIEAEWRTKP
ncbi:hypothetical protein GCM10027321_36350 [Massilia terrae]|uniref:PilN domain-containing protein n=1 Tax=Massilia terrae TaxID=1811224 RepID=A0ABT2D3J7_9BURK|nr:PilN domain-containing protein [Massilia terrae]MCS0660782.1 PilN domain-containing protein [Massilia terrae]